jgi:branched-chain amino acid transport system substrate-binding protein
MGNGGVDMSTKKRDRTMCQFTRREFLGKGCLAGTALAAATAFPASVSRAAAEGRDYILIGLPTPRTGAIAEFGEVHPWADERVIAPINAEGGIYIEEAGKSLPVKVKVVDTRSEPRRAAELATELIEKHKIDLMIVLHTPDTVNPVSKVCDRYRMPCVSMDTPLEAWLSDGPYQWSYHAFWSVDSLSDLFVGMWSEYANKTNKVFGGLWPDDPDGKVWAHFFTKKLESQGYKVIDPGRFPFWTPDFTYIIDQFKKEKVEIIGGVIIPPDWINFWRQARQDGFLPKMAAISKAIEFPSSVYALPGNLANGLTTEIWWSPHHPFKSALTGETPASLCAAWANRTRKQWTMPLGFAYATMEVALDAIKRAKSLDKEKLRKAIAGTDLNTVVGRIRYDQRHCCETPLVGGQWSKGKRWPWELGICYNKQHPNIPAKTKMVFPLPG